MGTMPKMQAHREGRLHRAISVFLYNSAGEMLLQRRADTKYHSGGLWSNASCSHPRENEKPHAAAIRRLQEEIGIRTPLEHRLAFLYRAELDSGLTEHELDHVFVGISDQAPRPDPAEVADWRWAPVDDIRKELAEHPERFTAWFPLALEELMRAR